MCAVYVYISCLSFEYDVCVHVVCAVVVFVVRMWCLYMCVCVGDECLFLFE